MFSFCWLCFKEIILDAVDFAAAVQKGLHQFYQGEPNKLSLYFETSPLQAEWSAEGGCGKKTNLQQEN